MVTANYRAIRVTHTKCLCAYVRSFCNFLAGWAVLVTAPSGEIRLNCCRVCGRRRHILHLHPPGNSRVQMPEQQDCLLHRRHHCSLIGHCVCVCVCVLSICFYSRSCRTLLTHNTLCKGGNIQTCKDATLCKYLRQ